MFCVIVTWRKVECVVSIDEDRWIPDAKRQVFERLLYAYRCMFSDAHPVSYTDIRFDDIDNDCDIFPPGWVIEHNFVLRARIEDAV